MKTSGHNESKRFDAELIVAGSFKSQLIDYFRGHVSQASQFYAN